jgi:HD-like signal output (HDOD) protein
MASPAPQALITQPPTSLAAWAALFDPQQLPILDSTARTLEELRLAQDDVDAHLLAEPIAADPLLTIKLLAHVAQLRAQRHPGRDEGDAETVTEALVMLGITPFFTHFGPQPTVQAQLADMPLALQGFERVLHRSRRAARFALGFAAHRLDPDAAVLHEAALLHDFAELLLWQRAPQLALRIAQLQAADSSLRSAAVQREVLHIELADLQHTLMLAWRLPRLLVRITDDYDRAPTAQVRNVQLAIRVARHSAQGWHNAALPSDISEIADLLHLSPDATQRLLHDIDAPML